MIHTQIKSVTEVSGGGAVLARAIVVARASRKSIPSIRGRCQGDLTGLDEIGACNE